MTVLFVTIGKPGHGKSFVSRVINQRFGAKHLDTDVIRKEEVADGKPTYSSQESAQTYDLLFKKAKEHLIEGRSVILDGTFNKKSGRSRAKQISDDTGTKLIFLHLECDSLTAKDRIRERDNNSNSDADVDVYENFRIAPLTDVENHVTIDNSGTQQETIDQLEEVIKSLNN